MWHRKAPASNNKEQKIDFWRLSNEDLLLHTLIHTAINHQFNKDTVRNLIDLIRLAQRLEIDWELLENRIRNQRVQTTVWLTLSIIQEIFGDTAYTPLLKKLEQQVGGIRQWLLKKLVRKDLILDLRQIHQTSPMSQK